MNDVQPFRIDIPQADVDDLRERLARARWPDERPNEGWERGVPLGYLRDLARYWRTSYDWRAQEELLNRHPQFTTEIDGQRVHFLHVRSGHAGAKPLLITHGYPSSVAEFVELIDPPPAVPQGFAIFGADETVRKLVPAPPGAHWSEFAHGRHFPALEAPADLAADLRAFFAPLS